jgi:hypothetical protein
MPDCRSCGNPGDYLGDYEWRRSEDPAKREPQCLACHQMLRRADMFRERRITDESHWRSVEEHPVDFRWCLMKEFGYPLMPSFRLVCFDQPKFTHWGDERMWLDCHREPLWIPPARAHLYGWAYWPGTEPKESE